MKVPTALMKAAAFCQEIKLKQDALISVSCNRFGDIRFFVEPVEFVRLFQVLKVSTAKLEQRISQVGDLHAEFSVRGLVITTMVTADEVADVVRSINVATKRLLPKDTLGIPDRRRVERGLICGP